MTNQRTDPISRILNKRYSEQFFREKAENLGRELQREGILIFDDFLSREAIEDLQREAAALKSKAYRRASAYNLYILPTDPSFPEDSPRNRKFRTTKGCIPDDQIPQDSTLRAIYDSKAFRDFLRRILKLDALYPYADTLSSININYYDPGDALEWHFDNADFAITLLVRKCLKGGMYEYFTDMRYTDDGEEDYERVRRCIDGEIEPKRASLDAGGLMIFRGNQSLHRVTEVEEGERVLVTFNFNTKPGVPLSEKSRQTFFGRTQ